MTPAARRVAPFVATLLALGLAACGQDAPSSAESTSRAAEPTTRAESATPTTSGSSTTQQENRPEQRELTAKEIAKALPATDAGPYPADPQGFDADKASTREADPESCLAIYLDTPTMRTFATDHRTAGKGILYTRPQKQAAPALSVAVWTHDVPYPQEFFDEAGAALAECATHDSAATPDNLMGAWQASSIPTQTLGDQSFGVRIGRPEFDMAVDYLWVRSGHNLISVRMRSGYSQNNDTRLGKYAQGVLEDLSA